MKAGPKKNAKARALYARLVAQSKCPRCKTRVLRIKHCKPCRLKQIDADHRYRAKRRQG